MSSSAYSAYSAYHNPVYAPEPTLDEMKNMGASVCAGSFWYKYGTLVYVRHVYKKKCILVQFTAPWY